MTDQEKTKEQLIAELAALRQQTSEMAALEDQYKTVAAALRQSEERLKLAMDAANDGLFDWNPKTGESYLSPRYYAMIGYEPGKMPTWSTLLHPDDEAFVLASSQELYDGKKDTNALEYRLRTKSGDWCWVLSRSKVIERDADGQVTRLIGTHVDITERKLAEVEREQLIIDLNAYTHTVAHDLKNPLNVILGYVALLTADYGQMSSEDGRLFLKEIEGVSQKMSHIIEALLLLANVRASDEIVTQPLEMGTIISESLARLAVMSDEQQATIVVPKESKWPTTLGVAPWVEEVWVNYISNAIKYGGTPPHIELGAEMENQQVRFWVRDNGAGISQAELSRLFTPFTRLDVGQIQGHGLGLSIVKRIVEKLGGQVAANSVTGQGSTFSFTLPKRL
jgi:PAS domain S-box-containing protein